MKCRVKYNLKYQPFINAAATDIYQHSQVSRWDERETQPRLKWVLTVFSVEVAPRTRSMVGVVLKVLVGVKCYPDYVGLAQL